MKRLLPYGIAFLLSSFAAIAQDIHMDLVPRLKDELQGAVYSMTQDNEGYLWLGTNFGLLKYDGTNYKEYRVQGPDPNGLTSDQIEVVFADREGYIWIGHYHNSSSLDRLNPKTGVFTHFSREENNVHSLTCDSVTAISQDAEGNIWIGTASGLNRYDSIHKRFDQFRYKENDPNSLSSDQIRGIYTDKQGTLWIGTGNPFTSENPLKKGGLNKFNKATGNFTRYIHHDDDPHSLYDDRIRAMYEDSHGNFWVGSAGNVLHKMNRSTGSFERFNSDLSHPDKINKQLLRDQFNGADDHITFIIEDPKGRLWIGTYGSGVSVYDPETKSASPVVKNNNANDSQEFGYWTAEKTRDGLLWIGSWTGNFYKVNSYEVKVPHVNVGDRIYAFAEDEAQSLWLAGDRGILRLDSTGVYKRFLIDKDSFAYKNRVGEFENDPENSRLWLGTIQGLYYFDYRTNKIVAYQPLNPDAEKMMTDTINVVSKDKDNHLWIGTNGGGLLYLDLKTGALRKYVYNPMDSMGLDNNFVRSATTDKLGNLWVGTANGVDRLDQQTGFFKKYIVRHDVSFVLEDSRGDIWVGTLSGFFRYNRDTDKFMTFSDQSGLVQSNWSVFEAIEDHQHNLWLNTFSGIVRLDKDRKESVLFGKNQGYNSLISTNLGMVRRNGDVLFGDQTGYFIFRNDLLQRDTSTGILSITSFLLNDETVDPASNTILKEPLAQTAEIKLNHDQNTFSFGFTFIDYLSKHEDTRVLYMLQNYENNWRISDENHEAYYFNLPPGKYIFKVKAISANGRSSEKQIAVTIAPPWWIRWWAWSLYALAAIAIVYFTDRVRKKIVIEKERARIKDRELAQAKEIEKAYTELKNTQAQLIHSEKMASLGELTAGIAHEIQNPLNFVNNFSEVNAELIDEAETAIDAGSPAEAKALLANLRNNEIKINHHGKRADAIVKGMLQHSRTGTTAKEPTDINALADEWLRMAYHGLRAQDKSFQATILTNYDPNLGKINIVPQDISRVLLNLYNNAFYVVSEKMKEHPKDYTPTVSVNTGRLNGRVEITVKDNGNGIPQKLTDKIFQPFFTTKPTGKGTGLGLSLSYDIIKSHGGEIKVHSIEGEGAEFVILLPV